MISAKLIKNLEKSGFELEFPSCSNEEMIIGILEERNERLLTALPLLLTEEFDYQKITSLTDQKETFDRILNITLRIYDKEGLPSEHIRKIIRQNRIKTKIKDSEITYYLDMFKESRNRLQQTKAKELREQIEIRSKLNLNQSLSNIYAPAKIRILDKIYNHDLLTNTELKYYYRSIRPLSQSILNDHLQKYIRITESIKKRGE